MNKPNYWWLVISSGAGIIQLWNDHLPQKRRKYIYSIYICRLFSTQQNTLGFFTICFYHPAGCGMPTFSFETVIGGEAAKVLSPQPKRGHRWPINQCPPWGATQINKEGFFSLQLLEGLSENLLKKLNHSFCHTYICTYILHRLHLHLKAVQAGKRWLATA